MATRGRAVTGGVSRAPRSDRGGDGKGETKDDLAEDVTDGGRGFGYHGKRL